MGGNQEAHMAFTVILDESGELGVTWRSRGVNGRNSNFEGDVIPEDMREIILEFISQATGKTAR
jgi:hypothetical protein